MDIVNILSAKVSWLPLGLAAAAPAIMRTGENGLVETIGIVVVVLGIMKWLMVQHERSQDRHERSQKQYVEAMKDAMGILKASTEAHEAFEISQREVNSKTVLALERIAVQQSATVVALEKLSSNTQDLLSKTSEILGEQRKQTEKMEEFNRRVLRGEAS